MITLHTWNTPNGQKPAIFLEEAGLNYTLVPIDIGRGDQNAPEFLDLNPNAKIPALIDDRGEQPVQVFESGAILTYLAEKEGKFLPHDLQARADALAWSFWQVGGLGPMIGQWGHFFMAEEKLPYAIERYLSETLRLFGVLESRLDNATYLAGEEYSIADMMIYPWASGGLKFLRSAAADRIPEILGIEQWIANVERRPAVIRAMEKLATLESMQKDTGGARNEP